MKICKVTLVRAVERYGCWVDHGATARWECVFGGGDDEALAHPWMASDNGLVLGVGEGILCLKVCMWRSVASTTGMAGSYAHR